MESLQPLGKMIFIAGLLLAGTGLVIMYFDKIPFIGRLPGDFTVKRENFTFYFPLATSIIISILLTLLMYFLSRRK